MDDDAVGDRLRKLAEQHHDGQLSDEEYAAAKRDALGDRTKADFAQETLMLSAVDEPAAPAERRRGLGLLVLAVAAVVIVLAAVVMLWPR